MPNIWLCMSESNVPLWVFSLSTGSCSCGSWSESSLSSSVAALFLCHWTSSSPSYSESSSVAGVSSSKLWNFSAIIGFSRFSEFVAMESKLDSSGSAVQNSARVQSISGSLTHPHFIKHFFYSLLTNTLLSLGNPHICIRHINPFCYLTGFLMLVNFGDDFSQLFPVVAL